MPDKDTPPLRDSGKGVTVGGWESRDGTYHRVTDNDLEKVGRAPTDSQLENARRIVINYQGKWYTSGPITPEYDFDDVIDELRDLGSL